MYLSTKVIDSVINTGKHYFLEVLLQECEYKIKDRIINF